MKKKVVLTKEEIAAVKKSIQHWKKDIQSPLLKGVEIFQGISGSLIWKSDEGKRGKVKCYDNHCPLCKIVQNDCSECPYTKKYGYACDENAYDSVEQKDGHWRKFKDKPTLRTCNGMIKALERIIG